MDILWSIIMKQSDNNTITKSEDRWHDAANYYCYDDDKYDYNSTDDNLIDIWMQYINGFRITNMKMKVV